MNILELSKKRFSARKFTDEAVSDDDLNYILEGGTHGSFSCQQTAMEVRHCEV